MDVETNDFCNQKMLSDILKQFSQKRIRDAYKYSEAGGQALLVPAFVCNWPGALKCFRGKKYGYLFDQDLTRLRKTAEHLGVRIIKIDRRGQPQQHINLCGSPLQKAIKEAEMKKNFKYYQKPFDINQPPPGPPCEDVSEAFGETKESKQRTFEYAYRLQEHYNNLNESRE